MKNSRRNALKAIASAGLGAAVLSQATALKADDPKQNEKPRLLTGRHVGITTVPIYFSGKGNAPAAVQREVDPKPAEWDYAECVLQSWELDYATPDDSREIQQQRIRTRMTWSKANNSAVIHLDALMRDKKGIDGFAGNAWVVVHWFAQP